MIDLNLISSSYFQMKIVHLIRTLGELIVSSIKMYTVLNNIFWLFKIKSTILLTDCFAKKA